MIVRFPPKTDRPTRAGTSDQRSKVLPYLCMRVISLSCTFRFRIHSHLRSLNRGRAALPSSKRRPFTLEKSSTIATDPSSLIMTLSRGIVPIQLTRQLIIQSTCVTVHGSLPMPSHGTLRSTISTKTTHLLGAPLFANTDKARKDSSIYQSVTQSPSTWVTECTTVPLLHRHVSIVTTTTSPSSFSMTSRALREPPLRSSMALQVLSWL